MFFCFLSDFLNFIFSLEILNVMHKNLNKIRIDIPDQKKDSPMKASCF